MESQLRPIGERVHAIFANLMSLGRHLNRSSQAEATKQESFPWELPPTWLRFLIIVLLVLGVFFRFVNLDRKVYWHDEVITSLHLAGHIADDLKPQVFTGEVIGVKDLQKYQHPTPQTSLMDTIDALVVEDPQHPPLYYVLARFWMQWFGSSVAVVRSVSAVISLLVFPCIYWLCLEVFESSLVGWVAIALVAVSPVHVVFAQEAREYSLLMVIILLSSASLLRAIRINTKGSWLIYAATLALGLYSLPLIALTALGHATYVITTNGWRWSKTISGYLLASVTGTLAFAPWILLTFKSFQKAQETTAWSSSKVPLSRLVKSWAGNVSRVFFDINLDAGAFLLYTLIPVLISLTLVIYSFYLLYKNPIKKSFLFVLTMIGVPALALIVPDLILGGLRSTVPRYLIPCYLGILLAVAYVLAYQIVSASLFQQKLWQVITIFVISAGIVSCMVNSQSQVWWNKKPSNMHVQSARIINKSDRPLLITTFHGANPGELLSMSYLLDPKVRLQLVVEPNIPKIPDNFSDVFVFNPTPALKSGLETNYNSTVEPVEPSEILLWKLKKR